MKASRTAGFVCGMALFGAVGGCESQEVLAPVESLTTVGGEPAQTFEEYMAEHVQPTDDGGYMVERDIHMADLDMVHTYWEQTVAPTGGLSVWRPVAGKDDLWNTSDRWNITYCIRTADFGTDYSRLVEMMHRAASGWEAAADVRFVHVKSLDGSTCNRQNTSVKYNVERNGSWTGNGLVAGMGFPSFSRSSRYLELGKTSAWTDEELLAVLTHEMGHSLGFVHEHDTASGCNFVTDDTAGYRQLTCYDGRSAMHYPSEAGWLDPVGHILNFISQRDVEGAQAAYGAPTNVVNTSDGTVYARRRSSGDLYRRNANGTWTKVGGPGQAFVAVGNTLYGQTPGGGSPVKYTGKGWVIIGGPAGQIFPCLGTLCATDKTTGNVAKYNGSSGWTIIGGPGSRFASTSTQLFGIGPWQDDYVARYSGAGASWSIVGGGASELFGGGASMYRLTNVKDAIQRNAGGSTWTTIGGSGRQFLTNGSNVYGLRPDGSWIMKYVGTKWISIHGSAARMYGSAGNLYATASSDEHIERYNASTNTWQNLGKP